MGQPLARSAQNGHDGPDADPRRHCPGAALRPERQSLRDELFTPRCRSRSSRLPALPGRRYGSTSPAAPRDGTSKRRSTRRPTESQPAAPQETGEIENHNRRSAVERVRTKVCRNRTAQIRRHQKQTGCACRAAQEENSDYHFHCGNQKHLCILVAEKAHVGCRFGSVTQFHERTEYQHHAAEPNQSIARPNTPLPFV